MKTSELLGYPKDARLLILNIDDYGLCYTANDAAIGLLKKGVVSSCTVMAPAPWGLHGVFLLKGNPEIKCGVHLTAISEHVRYRWRPLSSPEMVPSLVDEDGYFFLETRQDQFTRQADVHELELEFRLQIEFVLKHGVSITHLDSHCNTHDSRDDIFGMTVSLAREYGLALRVHNDKYMERLKKDHLPALDYPDLDSFRLPVEGKFQNYLRLLKELPEGLSEWAIHPAYESAELRAITPEWPVRASDYAFFNSNEFLHAVQSEGIILASYWLLQPFW
jgi:predicted glycoside hydrolase/deacetylase ChbG (UPF0249 family)